LLILGVTSEFLLQEWSGDISVPFWLTDAQQASDIRLAFTQYQNDTYRWALRTI
jgi:hypothetical protein